MFFFQTFHFPKIISTLVLRGSFTFFLEFRFEIPNSTLLIRFDVISADFVLRSFVKYTLY